MPDALTTRLLLPAPVGGDPANVPRWVDQLRDRLDLVVVAFDQGSAGVRPDPGVPGFLYWATDTSELSYDLGTAWLTLLTATDPRLAQGAPNVATVRRLGNGATDAAAGVAAVPVAGIIDWPASGLPNSAWMFVLPSRQSLLRTDYPDCFANLGGTSSPWGFADAAHFYLPWMAAGSGTITPGGVLGALGASGGEERHTLTRAEIPNYALPVTDPLHEHVVGGVSQGGQSPSADGSFLGYQVNNGTGYGLASTVSGAFAWGLKALRAATGISVSSGGSGTAHNNMPPSVVMNKIIRVL